MIQASDVGKFGHFSLYDLHNDIIGIGIVGKEGQQASLAADVSIVQFHHIARVLLWHGRNSCNNN